MLRPELVGNYSFVVLGLFFNCYTVTKRRAFAVLGLFYILFLKGKVFQSVPASFGTGSKFYAKLALISRFYRCAFSLSLPLELGNPLYIVFIKNKINYSIVFPLAYCPRSEDESPQNLDNVNWVKLIWVLQPSMLLVE